MPALLDGALLERARAHLGAFERVPLPDDGRRRAAVAEVLLADDEGRACFLITRRAATLRNHTGQWALPGGRIDTGETAEDAALRELREEVGLAPDAGALRYVGEIVDVEGPAEDHAHFFELHCDEEPVTAVDRREVVWAGFLRPEEALARGVVRVVRMYLPHHAASSLRRPG